MGVLQPTLDHMETMQSDEQVSGVGIGPDPALLLTIGR